MAGTARAHFREELHALEVQALGALDLVVTALDRTLEALRHQDIELATIVVNDDDRIDGRYLEVHQGILSLLARQAPVAGDLRIVAALLHVLRCMERMGDQCVNIAHSRSSTSSPMSTARRKMSRFSRLISSSWRTRS